MSKAKKTLPAKKVRLRAPRNSLHGKKIGDTRREMVFSVTKPDSRGAKRGDPEGCAAARAICRETGAIAAYVNRGTVLIEYEDRVDRYIAPRPLTEAITDFDRHGTTDIMEKEFRLLPASPSKRLGSDMRPSTRGGGADKRGAGPAYPRRYEIEGGRPRAPSHRDR